MMADLRRLGKEVITHLRQAHKALKMALGVLRNLYPSPLKLTPVITNFKGVQNE